MSVTEVEIRVEADPATGDSGWGVTVKSAARVPVTVARGCSGEIQPDYSRIADGEDSRHATVRSLNRSTEVRVVAQCRTVIVMGNHPVEYLRQRMRWSFDDSAGVLVLWIWCPSTGKFIELALSFGAETGFERKVLEDFEGHLAHQAQILRGMGVLHLAMNLQPIRHHSRCR